MTAGKVKAIEKSSEPSSPTHAFARQSSIGMSLGGFDATSVPQMAGNLAVQQLFRSGHIQAKLAISQPGDPDEQEADRVANQIMRKEEPVSIDSSPSAIQRKENPDQASYTNPPVHSQIAALRGGGQPLPPLARAFFEPRFGQDFGQVRVHNDEAASQSAQAIQAHAFTVGNHIAFAHGMYAPGSRNGDRLIAHELTHVIQQTGNNGISKAVNVTKDTFRFQRTPASPQGATSAAATPVDPKQAVIASMRLQLPGLVAKAYTDYTDAVSSIRAEIIAKKVEQPPPTDPLNIVLTVGMALVPWEAMAVQAATVLLGPTREALKATVISYFIRTNPLPFSPPKLEDHAIEALASAAGLLKNDGALKSAYKATTDGWKEFAKGAVTGSTQIQQTLSFLDACADEASNRTLDNLTGTLSDDQVVALWAAYTTPSLRQAFVGDLRSRARHFSEILAKPPLGKPVSFHLLDAYGRLRWAKLKYNTTSAYYDFLAWVPPDLESVVAIPGETPLPTSAISGPIPDPVLEQERIVRMDAWGQLRLARVAGREGVMYFLSWIPKLKYTEAEAEGQSQIGGLQNVSPGEVRNLAAPGPMD